MIPNKGCWKPSEQVGLTLAELQTTGMLAGFDSPAFYLPSASARMRASGSDSRFHGPGAQPGRASGLPFAPDVRAFLEDARR
jgi:hypothetical protein